MEPIAIHPTLSNDDQSSTVSTMVGPLFKQPRHDNVHFVKDTSLFDCGAREPVDPSFVPSRYSPAVPSKPSPSCRAISSIPTNPFLQESIGTTLHNTSPNYDYDIDHASAKAQGYGSKKADVNNKQRLKTARRREQCRVNQARYRLKQDRKSQLLKETVFKLEEEIPLLEMQRDRILFGAKQSVFNVVVEYFHLFRHGIRSLNRSLRGSYGSGQHAQNSEAQQQLVFLRSFMSSNVSLGDRCGVDILIELWRRYTTHFEDLHFQLEHMEERLKNLVAVSASMSVTITETTLKSVFPHLVGTALGAKLPGRRLMLPCEIWFEWNDARGEIVRLEMSVDFLMPMSRVLNSLKDAAFVLAQALITCDGSIGKFDL